MRQRELHGASIKTRNRAAIELREQIFARATNDVYKLAVERFLVTESFRVGDRGSRQIGVSPALAGVGAQIGCRVIYDFLAQRVVDLNRLAPQLDKRRSSAGF